MKYLIAILFFTTQTHAQVVEVITGLANPFGLAVDEASNLYISETNKISLLFLNDAVPAVFDLFTNDVDNPTRLKIANNYLYVVETGSDEISRFNLLSGPPQLIPYITTNLTTPMGIDVSNNDVIIGDYGNYAIKKINTASTPFQVSVLDNDLATDIAIDGEFFYYANPVYGYIKSNTIINPSPNSDLLISDIPHPSSLLFHNGLLYISDSEEGNIYRANLSGASIIPQLIASGLNVPNSMVVFNNELYIAESGANRIVKLNLNSLHATEFENEPSIGLSPNPVLNILNINTSETIIKVNAYDLLGKEVEIGQVDSNTFDASQLIHGFYIIKITTQKGIVSKKIIKN